MGGVGPPAIVVIGLMLVPYLDREQDNVGVRFRGPTGRKITLASALFNALVVIGMLVFTVLYGWLRNWYAAATGRPKRAAEYRCAYFVLIYDAAGAWNSARTAMRKSEAGAVFWRTKPPWRRHHACDQGKKSESPAAFLHTPKSRNLAAFRRPA
jgi:hypothetical protein